MCVFEGGVRVVRGGTFYREVVLFSEVVRGPTRMCIHAQCAKHCKQHEAAIYPRHTATLRSSPCEASVIPGPAQSKLVGAA